MSRPVQVQQVVPFFQPPIPENDPVEIPLLSEPRGMVPAIAQFQRNPTLANQLINTHYESGGRLSTGLSNTFNGSGYTGTGLSLFVYRLGAVRVSIVASTTGLWYRLGVDGTYFAMTGVVFSGLFAGDKFTFTTWGDKVVCTNPIVGMFEVDVEAKTYTKLTNAPQDAQFVTIFNGRLVASGIVSQTRRIQWSVKFSNSDWSGLGSGFEDLQPINAQSRNFPLVVEAFDDTRALVFREDSCDLMTATDRFDTPFVFSQLYPDLACASPYAVKRTKAGVVTISIGDMYLVTLSGFQKIGKGLITQALRGQPNATVTALIPRTTWVGKYHYGYDEYWLITPTRTFRYQFEFESWHEFVLDFGYLVIDVSLAGGPFYLAYASLPGLYSGLTGNLDDPASNTRADISVLRTSGESSYSADLTGTASGPDGGFTIITSDVDLVARNKDITITEMEIEYEDDGANDVFTVHYSFDFGATWTLYGTVTTVGASTEPRLITINKVITGHQVRFKISGTPTYKMRFNYIVLKGISGRKTPPYANT